MSTETIFQIVVGLTFVAIIASMIIRSKKNKSPQDGGGGNNTPSVPPNETPQPITPEPVPITPETGGIKPIRVEDEKPQLDQEIDYNPETGGDTPVPNNPELGIEPQPGTPVIPNPTPPGPSK
jgi:hypothetical protein